MTYRFDDVVVEPAAFRLLKAGTPVRIEPKALEVLLHLIERRERVVTKQELLDDVWRGTAVTENSLTRAVAQIRKLLGDDLQSPRYIQTVPTKGYRFIGQLQQEEVEAAEERVPEVLPAPPPAALVTVDREGDREPPRGQTLSPRLAGRVRRRTAFVVMATIIVTVIAIVAARLLVWFLVPRPSPPLPSPGESRPSIAARPLRATARVQSFPTFSPDGESVAYSLEVDGTTHIFRSRIGSADETQVSRGDGESQPAWSPDGKSIAYVALRRGGIWIVPATGEGEPVRLTTFGSRPQWSPDGREIAFQSDEGTESGWTAFDALPRSTIWIVNVSTGRAAPLTREGHPAGGHGAPAWRRDGNRLAFTSCEVEWCGIYTIARDGSGLATIITDTRGLSSPVFAREGNALYYVLTRYNNSLLMSVAIDSSGARTADAAPVRLRSSGPGVMQQVAISRDGFRLAWTLVEESSDLYSIPAQPPSGEGGEAKQLTRNPTFRSIFPAFSPDGTKIAYSAAAAGEDSGIWIVDADGANAKAVAVGPGLKQRTAWSRDGYSILYAAWNAQPMSWKSGPALLQVSLVTGRSSVVAELPRDASAPMLSPDGSTVAFNRTFGGVASVWLSPVARTEPRQLTANNAFARFPRWSPSGRQLAVQVRTEGGGSAVGVVDVGSAALKIITTERGDAVPYGWSPDGKEISFAARRAGVWNIYAIPVNGGRERKLTGNASTNVWFGSPVWSPAGDRIVYEAGSPKANVWISEERAFQ